MRVPALLIVLEAVLLSQPKPPETKVEPVTETIHGVSITDPYRWLEDSKSPATRAWIDAQVKYMRSVLDPLPGRDAWKKRLTELMRTDQISAPEERNSRYFYMKRPAAANRWAIYTRKGDGPEEVLVDPASISKDESTSIALRDVSPDGKLIAYGVQEGGADENIVRFLDVETRKDLADVLPKSRYEAIQITPDGTGAYFGDLPSDGPRVFYRPLHKPDARPEQIYGQGLGPDRVVECALSDDGRWLVLNVAVGASGEQTEVYLMDLQNGRKVTTLVKDLDARSAGQMGGGQIYLTTTWGAPKGRIFRIDPTRPQRHFWKLIVPEAPYNLEGVTLAGGRLLAGYLANVSSLLRVFETDGTFVRDIKLPGLGSAYAAGRWDNDEAYVGFASFVTPHTIYRYVVKTGEQSEWARVQAPIDPDAFDVEQVWYRSKDSTRIPMFVVSKKNVPMDGQRPTILYAYGGFTVNITPFFTALAAAWVERGGVYAVANIRGGAEFGEDWHRAGMLDKKQNVFDDFIAAGQWLVANKVTIPAKLSILGGSNGGLLVGAAMTQTPDLFHAVICEVPLLDMIRYQRFSIARLWVPEYGSSDDANQFAYLLKYSPYQNVKKGTRYPAVMFVTGDSDTRVDPLHARKMAALMQASTASGLPVLLHYDTSAGHSGGLPVYKQIDDQTDILSFLAWQLALN